VKRVVIESPYAGDTVGDIAANVAYARRAVRDSLMRGEAPIAAHLLHTQDGILNDAHLPDRMLGIAAGIAWIRVADLVAVYVDKGISRGMQQAIDYAVAAGVPVRTRFLDGAPPGVDGGLASIYGTDGG
jgi:hypothetical protein